MGKICVLGSINMDMVISSEHIPKVGETILGKMQSMNTGGKGCNQAIAARRLGSEVSFIGKVGKDLNGKKLVKAISDEGIDIEKIYVDEKNITGEAIILVNNEGNNSIVVLSGANMDLNKEEILLCEDKIKSSEVLISQFEVPMEAIITAFKIAKENGVMTVLNPAPFREIPQELIKFTDVIVPNETEIMGLTGVEVLDEDSAMKAAKYFIDKGVKYAIITLGEKGAALCSNEGVHIIPAFEVNVVDTTAAGDAFIGALSSKLSEFIQHNPNKINGLTCENMKEFISFANYISSIVVQKEGAVPSLPKIVNK